MIKREIKPRDRLIFHSENGRDYIVEVCNVNDFREPSMKYAIDLINPNGVSYYELYGDWFFCGDDFINKCEYVEGKKDDN